MPFKNNYMLPNSVVFSLIIIVAFFLMVSLCEKVVAFLLHFIFGEQSGEVT